jgi:hypothetical protein
VLVCAKTGEKIAIPHVKRKHFPLVYFEFTKRICRHPKVLYSDLASNKSFDIAPFAYPPAFPGRSTDRVDGWAVCEVWVDRWAVCEVWVDGWAEGWV